VDPTVAFQFDAVIDFVPSSSPSAGELVVFLKGTLRASESRYFHVYFDTDATGKEASPVQQLVVLENEAVSWPPGDDKAQESIFATNLTGSFYFHRQGCAFASVIDTDGNDWVSWKGTGGYDGKYRGLMNSWGPYHPGYTDCSTNLVFSGPVRTRFTVNDNTFAWDIYPTYVRATRLKGTQEAWWYEGTPGGALDAEDRYLLSDGTEGSYANEYWKATLETHWLAFIDAPTNRTLFMESHPGTVNSRIDQNTKPGPNTMIVVRFNLPKEPNPQYFTFGLVDSRDHEVIARHALSVNSDPEVNVGGVQMVDGTAAVAIKANKIPQLHGNQGPRLWLYGIDRLPDSRNIMVDLHGRKISLQKMHLVRSHGRFPQGVMLVVPQHR